MGNPLDEYAATYGEKRAAFGGEFAEGARGVVEGKALGRFAATTGIIMGAGMLVDAAHKAYDAATKSHDFNKMLEINPDLVEKSEQDPKMFNQFYSSLRGMNPHFAKDPVVAGSYMRKMTGDPTLAGGVLTEAAHGMRAGGSGGGGSGIKDFASSLEIARTLGSPFGMDALKQQQMQQQLEHGESEFGYKARQDERQQAEHVQRHEQHGFKRNQEHRHQHDWERAEADRAAAAHKQQYP